MHRLLPIAMASLLAMPLAAEVRAAGRVDLKVVRYPGSVQLRLEGMGQNPDIREQQTDSGWLIEVSTARSGQLASGPRFLAMPDAGMDSISFDGGGTLWRLEVTGLQGRSLGKPVITANGRDVEVSFKAQALPAMTSGSYDLTKPGRVQRNAYAPPLRKRATAPPVGDMAIGTIAIKGNEVRMPGAGKLERLTLRNAPARDVLMLLGRAGGYNVAFFSKKSSDGESSGGNPISVDFKDEPIEEAVNLVLTLGGLQAKRQGKTLIVGEKLPSFARQLMSRTVRLNQVSPARATEFLMSQGATLYRTKVLEEKESKVDAVEVVGQGGSSTTSGPTTELTGRSVSVQTVEAKGDAAGALPLRGLTVSPDDRLSSLTLTGEPNLVTIAEGYLKQIDLRKRQVAVRVQILDVDLNNIKSIDNSFAFRTGNSFIVNRSGEMLVNFGGLKPPSSEVAGLPSTYDGASGSPLVGAGAFRLPGGDEFFLDYPQTATPWEGRPSVNPYPAYRELPTIPAGIDVPGGVDVNIQGIGLANIPATAIPRYTYARPGFGPYNNPAQPGITAVNAGVPTWKTPTNFQYPKNQFFDFVTAVIKSTAAKIVADPTLMVQESESSSVGVGTTVFTNCKSSTSSNGTQNFQPVRETAGIQVNVDVLKIDDNGFVSLRVNPSLTAPTGAAQNINCGGVVLQARELSVRELKSGEFRVRDGQTLILTGVIQEDVIESVSKWPLLGDIPLIGQFFRQSSNDRKKKELVMVVTPRIVDDYEGGAYGYGYQPSTQAAKTLLYSP
ncbi:MAG: general secretion pathway protein GspD [Synechococcus sp. TMED155]|nr:MAG: general secretion pathway protein GspD [Synechococcus sp. TMED155]